GSALMWAIARRKLATASGLASLRKPMCVSLICTNVSASFAAAFSSSLPVAPSARGTPPATVQTTAAPVQAARQLNALRRAGLWGSNVLIGGSLFAYARLYRRERDFISSHWLAGAR